MINLLLNELKLIAQYRNISDYKNKSKEDLIKDTYRKVSYDIKNYWHLSESEIEEIRKNFNELEKSLMFKMFHGDIDSVDYNDLDNYDYNYDFCDDD